MKKRNYGKIILSVLLAAALLAAGGGKQTAWAAEDAEENAGARVSEAWINSDIDGAVTADTEVRLQDDFSLAVNKDYLLGLKIPEGKSQVGGFYDVARMTEEMRIEVMKDTSLTGHDAELVRKYYEMLSDWETRDRLGTAPLMPYVEEIEQISSLTEMTAFFADREKGGYYAFVYPDGRGAGTGCLFTYTVETSLEDPTARVISLYPVSLALGDSAEYEELTENGKIKKEKAVAVWTVVLKHLGYDEQEIQQMIDHTLQFETLLSGHMYTLEEARDPENLSKLWNPVDFAGAAASAGAFPTEEILKGWGLSETPVFNLAEPAYLEALGSIYTEENLPLMKDWLIVNLAAFWCNDLDRSIRDETTEAENKVTGVEGMISDDTDAMYAVLSNLPIPLDNLYIRKYCTPELREEITELIQDIVDGYRRMLEEETWLTEETREKAIEKLDALTIRAVYPEELEAWDDLEFRNVEEGGNLLEAGLTIRQYYRDRILASLKEKVDKKAWNRYILPISEANAYYDQTDNSINILAGILNGNVYQSDFSYEEKLGTIGYVIGHEISHAFDPSGAQYDKDGALNSWWTEEDQKAFNERAKKLIQFYDNIEPIEGIRCSGKLVQGEAVADMGGLKVALLLAEEEEDFDYEKFFRANARIWAVKRLKTLEIDRLQTDVHPLGYLRTNITIMQFDEFQETFGVKEGDGMYLATEERISVW